MPDQSSIAEDLEWVERSLAKPDWGFESLKEELGFLHSPEQARRYLISLRQGLEAVRDGQVMSHEEFVRRRAEHRRAARLDAAQ